MKIAKQKRNIRHLCVALSAFAMILLSLLLLQQITGQSYDTVPCTAAIAQRAHTATAWFTYPVSDNEVPPLPLTENSDIVFMYDATFNPFIYLQGSPDVKLLEGAFINAYLCDLNGDGTPELCATLSVGSGIADHRLVAFDTVSQTSYMLAHRFYHDYAFEMRDGALLVTKTTFPFYGPSVQTVCEGFPVLVETSHGIQLKIAVAEQ